MMWIPFFSPYAVGCNFFSVFNNDAIKDVKLYKGDIPASSGGRLASLLDIRMKDGNNRQFQATGGIGTISSRLTLEGPVFSEKICFLLSARRTYADIFLPFAKDTSVRDNSLFFYDLNGKVNYRIKIAVLSTSPAEGRRR